MATGVDIPARGLALYAGRVNKSFTTDVSLGHLESGTEIPEGTTIEELLQQILVGSGVAVTGVTLNKSITAIKKGATETLIATVLPPDATNKDVIWSSYHPNIASVENGVVRGLAVGDTVIEVTTVDGGFKATCTVAIDSANLQTYTGGVGNVDEQIDPSADDLDNMTSKMLDDEGDLVGQHAWHIVTGNSGNYTQYPGIVIPSDYEVIAWSADESGAYPVSSIKSLELENNLTMYYAPDPIYDYPVGSNHYITIIKK